MNKHRRTSLRRRLFLAGGAAVGAAALAAPLRARAEAESPLRLLIIHRPCGTRPERWFPTGGQRDWEMTELLRPFAGLREQMVVLKGIAAPRIQDWPGDKHAAGMISIMCAPPSDEERWPFLPGTTKQEQEDRNGKLFTSPAASVDQELLQNVGAFQGTPIGSLQLGASLQSMKGSGPVSLRALSYAAAAQALWPESRPDIAFDNVFGSVLTGADAATRARRAAQGKSVLDFVRGGIDDLKTQVPAAQLPKLDAHLDSIRTLEQSLSPRACVAPTLTPLPDVTGRDADDLKHALACEQQLRIIKTSFECDLTRVASFTFGYGNSSLRIARFAPESGISNPDGHHDISHRDDFDAQAAYEMFYNERTAKLLTAMRDVQEDNGMSLLDSTLVVYFSECGLGNYHTIPDVPVLLFGGKTLGLRGGSFLEFTETRTFADLWVETFKALGYDKQQHGAAMWNNGPLVGLYA